MKPIDEPDDDDESVDLDWIDSGSDEEEGKQVSKEKAGGIPLRETKKVKTNASATKVPSIQASILGFLATHTD